MEDDADKSVGGNDGKKHNRNLRRKRAREIVVIWLTLRTLETVKLKGQEKLSLSPLFALFSFFRLYPKTNETENWTMISQGRSVWPLFIKDIPRDPVVSLSTDVTLQ